MLAVYAVQDWDLESSLLILLLYSRGLLVVSNSKAEGPR